MIILKKTCAALLALPLVLLTACAGQKSQNTLESVMGKYGDVTFSLVEEADAFNFTSDIFTETKEAGIYGSTDALILCTVTAVNEIRADINMPVEKTVEEEEDGEDENDGQPKEKKTVTEYVGVTAYIQVLTVKVEKCWHGSLKEGDEARVMTRVSSRMWDETAIPLFENDECVLHLRTSESENDIMKIYSRGIAAYVLYDSQNGVVKKTGRGWLFGGSQEFLKKNSRADDIPFDELSDSEKKCYRSKESYEKISAARRLRDEVEKAIDNNAIYYFEK